MLPELKKMYLKLIKYNQNSKFNISSWSQVTQYERWHIKILQMLLHDVILILMIHDDY